MSNWGFVDWVEFAQWWLSVGCVLEAFRSIANNYKGIRR